MRGSGLLCLLPMLPSCIVVSAASTAVSVGVSAVGVATDVAVSTTKVAGKAVGAAVDAVSSDDKPEAGADKKPQGK